MAFVVLPIAFCLALNGGHASGAQKPDFLAPYMDKSVDPGVDFFSYANGGWIKKHPIPSNESSWGLYNLIRDQIYSRLRGINERSAKQKDKMGSDAQKAGDFWATGMDVAKSNRLGLSPLRPFLGEIDGVKSVQDCLNASFSLGKQGVETFFGAYVGQDEKRSDVEAVHLYQGGLGLPDRDYYFNNDPGVAKVRPEYVKYIGSLLKAAGVPDSGTAASNVMAFETSLAKISRKLEDLRDPEANYNKMGMAEVTSKLTPSINWARRFRSWGVRVDSAIVGQPEFFKGMDALMSSTSLPTLRNYMRFHLLDEYAPYLDDQTAAMAFHFNGQVLNGQKVQQPRWKRVMSAENQAIGFVLGRLYVHEYFPASEKVRFAHMVEAIRSAYAARIKKLTWMSDETKKKALIKLAALNKKVGYPDKWKDYTTLAIGRRSFCENMMSAARWEFQDDISKLGKPVDRTEWGITPQTFDAYYEPTKNEIVLPAVAFDLPGMKASQIDEAVMYGNAGGSWVGHEMTHGFDDEGRQFDPKGNLKDWWTKADAANFKKRAELMIKQFDAYEPLPGMHINGKATLGENIADYGGVQLGFDAFKKTKAYKSGKKIGGLTPVQRYFLGFALSWLEEQRPEGLRRQLLSDVHSPDKYRCNGPLSNLPSFYDAFGVKPGQPMWRAPDVRVHIW